MSTDNIVNVNLKHLDQRVAVAEKQLSWPRRIARRYLGGRSFIAGQVIWEPYGMIKGVLLAGPIKAGLSSLAIKFPALGVFWESLVAVFEGMVAVGSSTS